jgi:hypothetical protein
MIMLSASIAVLDAAQAQTPTSKDPHGYGSMQVPTDHRQRTQDDLQPTSDERQKIDKDNHDLDLPASQDPMAGAGPVPTEEDVLTRKIEQDDVRLDREIAEICPSCGRADDARVHQRQWPIHHGFNHQPTRIELRALHQQDVTPAQAQEIDRLYDQLLSRGAQGVRRNPAP